MASTDVTIPAFEATPIDQIAPTHERLRQTFRSSKTKDVEYRLVQLRRLYWSIRDNKALILAALHKDLRKSELESMMAEIDWCMQDCMFAINNLNSWAKDEKCKDVPLQFALVNARIRKDPLGVALVIGAYNFPFMLSLSPFIGAIAAGCPAVLKPSEGSPATAMALEKVIRDGLDPTAYTTVNGAVPETTALLDLKWDKIFYTGGSGVGTIIAKKAAETLTPVTLELGGRNPAFVTRDADIRLAARRILWGKVMNAGQVCLSSNYVLVDRSVLSPFIQQLKETYNEFFPEGAKKSPDYSRIINKRHFLRMKKMVDDSTGKVVLGGDMDEDDLYIEPTVVQVDNINDSMMTQESFGPIFAVMPFKTLEEATNMMNEVDPTPLSLFAFGTKKEQQQILTSCLSGGASMNDSFLHASIPTIPFGGVGTSGTGAYRGRASFDSFTHNRTITTTPNWMDKLLRVRYMPYSMNDYSRYTKTLATPGFDRSGQVVTGVGYWVKFVLGLGGNGAKDANSGDQELSFATIKPQPTVLPPAKDFDLASQQHDDQLSRASTVAGESQL